MLVRLVEESFQTVEISAFDEHQASSVSTRLDNSMRMPLGGPASSRRIGQTRLDRQLAPYGFVLRLTEHVASDALAFSR